jgi:hypothetical protein
MRHTKAGEENTGEAKKERSSSASMSRKERSALAAAGALDAV